MISIGLEAIKDLVQQYVRNEGREGEELEIEYDKPLISSGFVDSIAMISLLVFLENKFNIKIPLSRTIL